MLMLRHACKTIEFSIRIPHAVGNQHWTGRISDVLSHYISIGVSNAGCELLEHPVDSIDVMHRNSAGISNETWTILAFHRFLLHIIEHSYLIQGTEEEHAAAQFVSVLKNQLATSSGHEDSQLVDADSKPTSDLVQGIQLYQCSMILLSNNSVISPEIAPVYERVNYWSFREQCGGAVHLFLCLFNTINTSHSEPRQILNWFYGRPELSDLFSAPWSIDGDSLKSIWESLS